MSFPFKHQYFLTKLQPVYKLLSKFYLQPGLFIKINMASNSTNL